MVREYVAQVKTVAVVYGGAELRENVITGEEVVRCRDCLHSETSDGMVFCRMASTGQWRHAPVSPDGFCAWAQRAM